jgi:epoxyqueuosine reductase
MPNMSEVDNTRVVKHLATELGFDRVGIAAAKPVRRVRYLEGWLDADRCGSMDYLRRNAQIRTDPANLIEDARSVIVVAVNYYQTQPPPPDDKPRGRVAMYAWGDDYHDVVKARLRKLADAMHERIPESFTTRCCVDTVPILERELAESAGIGWIGKNTLVLNEQGGSYFFLGEIVTTLALVADEPVTAHCGTCTACLDACPTGAFPSPYQMDASKCISYLTIEHRTPIDEKFHDQMRDWVFGCDICQEVCPFNKFATPTDAFPIRPERPHPLLDDLESRGDEEHRAALKGSAMVRANAEMLRRNATIVRRNINRSP